MKPLRDIYREHMNLLKEKGYDQIGSPPNLSSRRLIDDLLFKLSKSYANSLATNTPQPFYLKCEVNSNSGDKVKLVLNYSYNPADTELYLSNLYVTCNEVSTTIFLKQKKDIPTVTEAINHAVSNYQQHPKKVQDDFKKEWKEHIQLLRDKGYDEQGLGNNKPAGSFATNLTQAFKNALFENIGLNIPFCFTTKNEGYFNNFDQVDFTFHYEYDPRSVKLQLKSLEAERICKMNFLLNPKIELLLDNEEFLCTSLSKSLK